MPFGGGKAVILADAKRDKTPELLTAVWVGYDDNQSLGLTGSQAALPIWTGFMRRALGVDQFGFRPGATEDDPGSVAVGTYVSDGVYVGVQQGMRPGSTGVTVEIDITDNIKAHSDMGADGRNRAGVRWQMDY